MIIFKQMKHDEVYLNDYCIHHDIAFIWNILVA